MKWFKFYGTEYLSDPKMLSLTPEERSCWITLLCYASVNGDNANDNESDNGTIRYLDEQKLMLQAGLDFTNDCWDRTVGVLKKFENLGMIRNDNGMITVLNWGKRQNSSLTGYERVKRYRERHKNDNASDNAMITSEERRGEKIREEEKNSSSKKKAFYENQEMRWSKGRWWVLPLDGGEWLEYNDSPEKIEWR